MIIDHLIRLGRPFVDGGLPPSEVIRQVSDILDSRARGFLEHVVIVEVDTGTGRVATEWVRWIQEVPSGEGKRAKTDFIVDEKKAQTAPFVVPSGGNPTNAQGRYGFPSYIFYQKHVEDFAKEATEVRSYLTSRLDKTSNVQVSDDQLDSIVSELHSFFRRFSRGSTSRSKTNGLIVLSLVGPDSIYRYEPHDYILQIDHEAWLLESSLIHGDRGIVADLDKIAERFWESKIAEGEEKGRLTGENAICSHCGSRGDVVSIYSKAWNWFTTTWEGPLSIELKDNELVEGVGLCPLCYRALTYGSNIATKLTTPLPQWLARELFSPSDNPAAQEAQKRGASRVPTIYGSVLALPLLDSWLDNEDDREEFVDKMSFMMSDVRTKEASKSAFHLKTITGLEMWLPELDDEQVYRLSIIYYSGDPGRADIHLRAMIEDVLPSSALLVNQIIEDTYESTESLRIALFGEPRADWMRSFYLSLPSLLIKAYGPAHVWTTLARVLHRQELDETAFLRLSAKRLKVLAARYKSRTGEQGGLNVLEEIKREVLFYMTFHTLLNMYRTKILQKGERELFSWQQLMDDLTSYVTSDSTSRVDPPEWEVVEHLGFATGFLVREFGKRYYRETEKDFLETRVVSFGNQITPDVIYKYGLLNMRPIAARHRISMYSLEKLYGSVLSGFLSLKTELRNDPDTFMAAFWSGYSLNQSRATSKEQGDDEAIA